MYVIEDADLIAAATLLSGLPDSGLGDYELMDAADANRILATRVLGLAAEIHRQRVGTDPA